MNVGETRKFKIDKRKKKNCGPPGSEIAEIEIRKETNAIFAFAFRMLNTDDEVFVNCYSGFVALLKVRGKAEQCGIGKILMQLCLNEEKIHSVKGNDENGALKQIDAYKKRYKNEKFDNLKKWVISDCSKVFYLEMEADPKSRAHVYFNSAIESGFTEIVMFDNLGFYPKEGPCSVEIIKGKYDVEGNIDDGGKKTFVWGMNWVFCYPKKPKKLPKCTIL